MAITNKVLEFTLELTPGGIPPIIHASQGDVGRTFKANVVWNGSAASAYISGTTVKLRGKKPDKTVFDYSATLSGSSVTFATTEQMTIISGPVECELVFTSGDDVVATANFILCVEESPYNPDAVSESVVPGIEDLIEDAIGGDVPAAVDAWLDAHPEATTTVQDGAITKVKINTAFLPEIENAYVTPEMFGAVGDGTTDDTAAIQAAIEEANTMGTELIFPSSVGYKVTQPIVISNPNFDVKMFGPIIYNGSGVALTIGRPEGTTSNRVFSVKVEASSPYKSGSTGIKLINLAQCIIFANAAFFETGIGIYGDTRGFAYNKISIQEVKSCLVSLALHNDNSGWVNENQFYGGRYCVPSSASFIDNTIGILITTNGNYQCNANVFYSPCVEKLHTGVKLETGCWNQFLNVRTELVTVPFDDTQGIAENNFFSVSYGENPTATNVNNVVYNKQNNIMRGLDKVVFDSGYMPANAASNDSYGSVAKMAESATNKSAYKVRATPNYVLLNSGRRIGVLLEVDSGALLFIKAHYLDGTSGRYIIQQFDSEDNTLSTAPLTVLENGGTVGANLISGSTTNEFATSKSAQGVYAKLSTECTKVFIAVYGQTDAAHIDRFVITSNKNHAYKVISDETNPVLAAIPTNEGHIGQFVKCLTPATSNIVGWVYTENNTWVQIPLT